MDWWEFGIWGLAGGLLIEALEVQNAARLNGGILPPAYTGWAFWIGEVIRVLGGGALAVAFGQSAVVTTPVAAMAIGISTPVIVEKLKQARVPLAEQPQEPTAAPLPEAPSDPSEAATQERPD